MLHSYHAGFSWTDNITRGLRRVLSESTQGVELCFEFMDAKRLDTHAHHRRLAELYRGKYADRPVQVLIVADDPALHFLLHEGRDLFPGVPAVFCAVNDYDPAVRASGRPLTGVVETAGIHETMEVALRLHPGVRQVAVISDDTLTGRALQEAAARAFREYENRLRFTYLDKLTLDELQARVAALPDDALVFAFMFRRDEFGRALNHELNMERLAAHCPVPIYSVWEFYLGHGIVGGMLSGGTAQGEAAAQLALRVLRGEDAASIPVVTESPNRLMFDYRQLARFGIAAGRLPPGAIVVNRPFSFYQAYKTRIWAAGLVLTLAGAGLVIVAANVARRRRAEHALRTAESLLHAAIEQSPAGVVVAQAPDGQICLANSAALEIRGAEASLVTNIPASLHAERWQLYHADGRPCPPEEQPLLRAVLHGETNRNVELRIRRDNGEDRWVLANAAPVRDARGRIVAGVVVFTDVTDAKRAEHEHCKLEAQLRQAQKMEAVGQLAGGVAHDFNNILTAIFGNVELAVSALEAQVPGDARVLDGIQQIERSAQRASALTRQLLAFSRQQVAQPVVVDLNRTLSGMEDMLRRLIEEDISLELRLAPALNTICADASQIEQVIMNLVVNARDAMKNGGRLTIETANVAEGASAAARPGMRPGPCVVLAVTDTGCGIDAATLDRVFEPFFTTKGRGQGTGLGLATVYTIVRQSGGHITADSEPGQGSTFRVYLPSARGRAVPASDSSKSTAEPTGTETILLCEDDRAVRDLAAHILRGAGYRVLDAEDGGQALQLAANHDGPIHLLLTDVIMPDMNGRRLADTILAGTSDIRILFVSGYTSDVIGHHGVLDEGVEFLAKPFSRRTLLARVRQVLDGVPQHTGTCGERNTASEASPHP
ncbi:MAG: ATP-binding protein [Phycisphaerae bacterium]